MRIRAINILLAKTIDGRSPVYPGEIVELDDKLAKELISLKAAVEVQNSPVATADKAGLASSPDGNTPEGEDGQNGPENGYSDTGHLDAEQLQEMSFSDLKKLAEDMNIDTKGIRSKSAMIEAITAVEIEYSAGDDAPALSVQDVIE